MAKDKTTPTTTTTPAAATPSYTSDDFTAMFSQLQSSGLFSDSTTLSSIWGNSLDDNYPVQRRKSGSTPNPNAYLSGGASAAQAAEFQRANKSTPSYTTDTSSDLLKKLFASSRSDPSGLSNLQQKLFAGGFYQKSARLDDIEMGTLDDLTMDAYYSAMQWTARYNQSDPNSDLTVDGLIDERAKLMLGPLRDQLAKQKAAASRTISLADPAGLAQAIDQVASSTVGRKATPDEQRMFVSMFHALQTSAQSVDGGVAINPDVGGQAEQFMMQHAPVEAKGHAIASTFNNFLQIIGGMGSA